MAKKIYLVLQNGEVFEGKAFGCVGDAVGEVVFTTGMNGFIETLTDPDYYGQIVVQTFPLVGGYGFIQADACGKKPVLKGYVVREHCDAPSNFRCERTLDAYLREQGVVGLYDIDTRELTTRIRDAGVMNAKITDNIDNLSEILREIRMYAVSGGVEACTRKAVEKFGIGKRVAVLDLGNADGCIAALTARGCEAAAYPARASAAEILADKPAGIVISDGPGDPQDYRDIVNEIAKLTESGLPVYGISMGHELLALAMGAHIRKLKFGHRGGNQPVKRTENGRVYITAQNHGFSVISKSLPPGAKVTFTNVNDGACEGVEYAGGMIFGTQFCPSEGANVQRTTFLYDRFLQLTEEK